METLAATKWSVDKAHSEIQFKVKHLVITTVTGQFNDYDANLEVEGDDLETAKATFTARVGSLTTHNADRDAHLKSSDFFDAEAFPELSFVSKSWKKTGADRYEVKGDLSIKGVSKEVVLQVEHGGTATDPWGNTKTGFEISGVINRLDWGLKWNVITEAGSMLVGEEVKLVINAQFALLK